MPSPYATDEDSKSLWLEQSNYISTHIAAIAYGFHASVFFAVIYIMLRPAQSRDRRWVGWLLMSIALFCAGTITLACSIGFNEDAWVSERGYPGGSLAFLTDQQGRPIVAIGDAAYLVASVLADGLLLYRVYIVWNGLWYIVTPLGLFYVGTIVLTIVRLLQLHSDIPARIEDLGVITWTCFMAINIALPAATALRILIMRRSVHQTLGREHLAVYTGAVAIIIETALPFVIVSIVLLVLFGGQNTTQYLFLPLLAQTTCIAPLLIILRSQMRSSGITFASNRDPSTTADKTTSKLPTFVTKRYPSSLGVVSEQSTLGS